MSEDGWSAAARSTLEASLRATPAQRLAWLEEAMELVWRAGTWPARSGAPAPSSQARKLDLLPTPLPESDASDLCKSQEK